MSEVQTRQVDKGNQENDLGPNKVAANEKHNEGELEQVEDDEVASNTGSCIDIVAILREEVANVSDLENEQNNPVDGGNDRVQGKCSVMSPILTPNRTTDILSIVRLVNSIVDGGHKNKQKTKSVQDLVGSHGGRSVCLPLGEWVGLMKSGTHVDDL